MLWLLVRCTSVAADSRRLVNQIYAPWPDFPFSLLGMDFFLLPLQFVFTIGVVCSHGFLLVIFINNLVVNVVFSRRYQQTLKDLRVATFSSAKSCRLTLDVNLSMQAPVAQAVAGRLKTRAV